MCATTAVNVTRVRGDVGRIARCPRSPGIPARGPHEGNRRANQDVRGDRASGRVMSAESSIVVQLWYVTRQRRRRSWHRPGGCFVAANNAARKVVNGCAGPRSPAPGQRHVNSTCGVCLPRSGSNSHNQRRAPRSWVLMRHSSPRASMILECAIPVSGWQETYTRHPHQRTTV